MIVLVVSGYELEELSRRRGPAGASPSSEGFHT
jgi:hypothetical protein